MASIGGYDRQTIRIGSGAGYSDDRIEPAIELAERGGISYLGFECLAERTIALAQAERMLLRPSIRADGVGCQLGPLRPSCDPQKILHFRTAGAMEALTNGPRPAWN